MNKLFIFILPLFIFSCSSEKKDGDGLLILPDAIDSVWRCDKEIDEKNRSEIYNYYTSQSIDGENSGDVIKVSYVDVCGASIKTDGEGGGTIL